MARDPPTCRHHHAKNYHHHRNIDVSVKNLQQLWNNTEVYRNKTKILSAKQSGEGQYHPNNRTQEGKYKSRNIGKTDHILDQHSLLFILLSFINHPMYIYQFKTQHAYNIWPNYVLFFSYVNYVFFFFICKPARTHSLNEHQSILTGEWKKFNNCHLFYFMIVSS